MSTATEQKPSRSYIKHGMHRRDARIRARGLSAIDRRAVEGRIALDWRDHAIKAKGGAACPFAIKTEIRLACFDLWRLLCLQTWMIADASARGTIVNRRRRELSRVHEQYDAIDARFLRRCEALGLIKGSGLDLASRLAAARRAQDGRG